MSSTPEEPAVQPVAEPSEAGSPRPEIRVMDLESLKALAHPLRVKIVDTLSTYGEFTASGLAERLGESSGATSYHLRQLEKHGFVREVVGRGTGRERWWERTPGGIMIGPYHFSDSSAAKAATRLISREWANSREQALRDFTEMSEDAMPDEWVESSVISLSSAFLDAEQLHKLSEALMAIVDEHIAPFRGQKRPGTRPVQIHVNAFPVVDGDVVPSLPTTHLTPKDPS
jgi:DNA-binding transcriptional ArsR family regulator